MFYVLNNIVDNILDQYHIQDVYILWFFLVIVSLAVLSTSSFALGVSSLQFSPLSNYCITSRVFTHS